MKRLTFPFALALLALTPFATATEDGPFPCDKDPVKLLIEIATNIVEIVVYAAERGVAAVNEAALKAKCTAFEFSGTCVDDDNLITISTKSTGSAHPHRGRCYEYVFVPGPNDPHNSSCPANQKILHDQRPNGHFHTCVPITQFT